MEGDTRLVYRSASQGLKVQAVAVFSVLVLLGTTCASYRIATRYGLSPADGGVLRPVWQRWSLALGLLAMAAAFAVGMGVYGARYVDRIEWLAPSRQFRIRTLGWPARTYLVAAGARVQLRSRRDVSVPGEPLNHGIRVDAPWLQLQLERPGPCLILDLQGWLSPEPDLRQQFTQAFGHRL